MGTLVVVHGAGVREAGINRLEANIKNGIADIAELKDLAVVMCRWGPEVGSMPARVSETLPKEVITRAAIQTPDDEQLEAARWSLLFDDPLFELRVAQAAPAGEAATVAIGQVLAAQAAIEALQGLTSQANLPGPDTGIDRNEFAQAVEAIASSREIGMAADRAGSAADKEFVEAVARAVVAELIARHRLDAPGTQPALAVNGMIRDRLVATLTERLAPDGTRGAIGWLKDRMAGFIAKRATALAADRRMAAQEASSGLVADVVHYLRRGKRIAEYVADCLKDADGPVIALGHSLGGIVLVDILSRTQPPPVDLLVTVGSQAPVLYAYDALERPRDARDGSPRYSGDHPPFTPWLNIYNRNDFVSFLADDIFSHEIGRDLPIVDQELRLPEAFPAAHGAYWTDKETFRLIAAEAAKDSRPGGARLMIEGPTTWALVVGIDEYDSPLVPKLKGAAADAAEAVTWLRRLGVPDGQIFLHAAPAPESKALVEGLRIPFNDARDATIWSSVSKLLDVTDGTRLFVFLCGHGLYEPSTKRIFLTQEAGVDRVYSNLGIELYIDLFLSTVFPRQFLIMDGCLNLPYSPAERQKIRAAMRNGIDPAQFTPKPGNSLIACFGAAQGQRVVEIGGRGAFMRRLLKAMDPDNPAPAATTLDWTTGRLEVDILNVMTKGVAAQVEADANNLTPRVQQTPQPLPYGFRRIDGRAPMFEVAPKTPVTLEVRVMPTTAAPDLTSIHLWVDEPPFQLSFQQPDQGATQVTPPVVCRVPPSLNIRAECRSRSGTPWAKMAELRLHEDADKVVVFDMTPPAPAPGDQTPRVPPPDVLEAPGAVETVGMRATTILESRDVREGAAHGVEEAHYGVKLSVGGFGWGGLTGAYNTLESNLGYNLDEPVMITGDGSPWLKINRGMLMQRHEDGPEFRVKPNSVIQARRVVSDWAEAIRIVVPPNVTVHTIIEDVAATPSPPNLRLVMPGGARGLAGALAGHPTVYIGPPERAADPVWRTKSGRSLKELEASAAIRVDPGPVEVRVDLPWGSWSKVVKAPSVRKPVQVTLPRQIGSPPLRVPLAGQVTPDEYTIFGVHGPALTGRLIDVTGQTQAALIPKNAGFASWGLGLPTGIYPGSNNLVELSGHGAARFPAVNGWSVAVDWSDKGLRVEPLSSLASPEWDLLVATGRLDSLTTKDAVRLTEDKWFDAILGLAGAYAVYAAADWTYLTVVTRNLRSVAPTGVDVDLLSIAANRGDRRRLPATSVEQLGRLAQEQRVPVMRWGVALALELLTAAKLDQGPWASSLSQISETISTISPWTAWTE